MDAIRLFLHESGMRGVSQWHAFEDIDDLVINFKPLSTIYIPHAFLFGST